MMRNANSLSQHEPMSIEQNEPLSAELDRNPAALLPENQKQQDSSLQEANLFSFQHKPSQDDSCIRQAEQNMVLTSQAINMWDSENNMVHKQGPVRTRNTDHDAQPVNLQEANNARVQMLTMSNQRAVATAVSNQQAVATDSDNQQASYKLNHPKQISFHLLLPIILPQLDKDRAMQVNSLFLQLRKNELSNEGFLRLVKSIVGDQIIKMAANKFVSQNVPRQLPSKSQISTQLQNLPTTFAVQMMTNSSNQFADSNSLKSLERGDLPDSHGMRLSQLSTSSSAANQDMERTVFPSHGLHNQQPQPMHFSHASFPTYGNTGSFYQPYSAISANTPASPHKQQPHDSRMRPTLAHQTTSAAQLGITTTQVLDMVGMPKLDSQNIIYDPTRWLSGTLTSITNNLALPQNLVQWQSPSTEKQKSGVPCSMTYVKLEPSDESYEQYESQFSTPQGLSSISSVNVKQGNALLGNLKDESCKMQSSSVGFSTPTIIEPSNPVVLSMPNQIDTNNLLNSRIPSATFPIWTESRAKVPTKNPSVGQKKPLEALGSSPTPSSKKRKVSGAFLDQSIEQLNDVTAVSGVNIREEEERLFCGPNRDSQVSEASGQLVQEEEDRLILEKIPLQRKLAEIMEKGSLKGISNDVERCLSLCVEERMRRLIGNLIRLSKQRVDVQKPRHRTSVTSDVHNQLMSINQKAREELKKKQSEAKKLQNLSEPEGNPRVDSEKEKDEGSLRPVKGNKEEYDKMRTTAANVAARAAVRGDNMLFKWQLMAEQARQKLEGRIVAAPGSQAQKDMGRRLSSSRSSRDNQEVGKKGHSVANPTPEAVRRAGRNQVVRPQSKVARTISVKDVIAVLEREHQMSKTTLMSRLYEKFHKNAGTR